jgi:large subunit ribosomal protein L10
MKSFTRKKEEFAKLKDKLAKAKITIFTSFARAGEKGLNVSDTRSLKKDLNAINSEYLVGKKTLLDKALKDNKKEVDIFQYEGSIGVAFGYGDEQSTAKSVYTFAKKHPALRYFGAIWNGKFLDMTQFAEFAKLPSKEAMIAKLLGMMKYPISALAIVLDQIAKSKE